MVATHVGLECGTFKQMNPEVDMISIGPDIDDAHTVNETLHLASIPKLWNCRIVEMVIPSRYSDICSYV